MAAPISLFERLEELHSEMQVLLGCISGAMYFLDESGAPHEANLSVGLSLQSWRVMDLIEEIQKK